MKPDDTDRIGKVLYTAKTHTTGGRDWGVSRSADGRQEIKFLAPAVSGIGTNPEQLFAAGWSACMLSAIKVVAVQMKITIPHETAIDAEIDLGLMPDGAYGLAARFTISLPGVDPSIAKKLVEGAHNVCPYSRATEGNIDRVDILSIGTA